MQRNPARSYWMLASQMYKKRFDWFVANDGNRVEDAKELRFEFIKEREDGYYDKDWMEEDCSFIEILIVLSRMAAFETDGDPYVWLWTMLDNLKLRTFVDDQYNIDTEEMIDNVLDTVIQRKYNADGSGGLFPLREPDKDQTKIEIWYQMATYLLEQGNA